MNCVIEGNLSFSELLEAADADIERGADASPDECRLSLAPLGPNAITLKCGHRFDYMALYRECAESHWDWKIPPGHRHIVCPYWREPSEGLLPYHPRMPGVELIRGVTSPQRHAMPGPTCTHVLARGPRVGQCCGKPGLVPPGGTEPRCTAHWSAKVSTKPTQRLPANLARIGRTHTLARLRELAKQNSIKSSGPKNQLLTRLVNAKVLNGN